MTPGKDYDVARRPSLKPFVATANVIVNRLVTKAEASTPAITISTADQELLERWIAAWAYKNSDLQLAEKSTSSASGKATGKTEKGLESNFYGQTALTLDPTGLLKSLTSGARARMAWLGKPPSTQIDYVDRS